MCKLTPPFRSAILAGGVVKHTARIVCSLSCCWSLEENKMHRFMFYMLGFAIWFSFPGTVIALNIIFDYSLDTTGFFDRDDRRESLGRAAAEFEALRDNLPAISGLRGYIVHPSTDEYWEINDVHVPEDTVLIYVGARDLDGALGRGGRGSIQCDCPRGGPGNYLSTLGRIVGCQHRTSLPQPMVYARSDAVHS